MPDLIIAFLYKYGVYGVMISAFAEAIFFPPPVEIVLLPLMMADTNNAIFYAVITVLVSLAGSAVGYYVGSKAGKPLLIKFFGEEKADRVKRIYDKYGVFAVASSAFTPIPYEAYTLSAGAFKMNFKKYMLGVLLGRILRYLPEGVAVQLFGHAIDAKDLASMSWFVMVVLVIFVLYGIIRKRWESRV